MLKIFEDAIGFFYCVECVEKEDGMIGAIYVPERENVENAIDELNGDIRCNWCGENLEDAGLDFLNACDGVENNRCGTC